MAGGDGNVARMKTDLSRTGKKYHAAAAPARNRGHRIFMRFVKIPLQIPGWPFQISFASDDTWI